MRPTRSHCNRLCTHRPVLLSLPRRAIASSGNISNLNPKSGISSMLVDARTKHHLACANTETNVSSATAITQRPRVLARALIKNKRKPDTPLQPEVLHCHYTITLIVHLLNHCFGHYFTVSILATLMHVTFVYLST